MSALYGVSMSFMYTVSLKGLLQDFQECKRGGQLLKILELAPLGIHELG